MDGRLKTPVREGRGSLDTTNLNGASSISARRLRILYASGPGDALGMFERWTKGNAADAQVSLTYSGQFFDACHGFDADVQVVGCGLKQEPRQIGRYRFCSKPTPFANSTNGLLFHLGQWWYGIWLWWCAIRFRADVALVSQGTHWHMLSLMAICGIRVIPSLHTNFWPRGCQPRQVGPGRRVVTFLDRLFWKRGAWATLVLSPEVQRQLSQITGPVRGPVLRWRLLFPGNVLNRLAPPDATVRPFRIVYGGRLERGKGVFDLLETARRLESARPGTFHWDICGDGAAGAELGTMVRTSGLEHVVTLHGLLDGPSLLEVMERSHVMVVPTTASMAEGFARSAAESVMAGRPVVLSSVVPAVEELGDAALEVPAGNIDAYEAAFSRLADDEGHFQEKVIACAAVRKQFQNPGQSWGSAVRCLLQAASRGGEPEAAAKEFAAQ